MELNDRLCFYIGNLDIARKSSHKEMVRILIMFVAVKDKPTSMDVCSLIKTVK
jgi:hypothetical protein